MKIIASIVLAWSLLTGVAALPASEPSVYKAETAAPLEQVYPKVYAALEANRFFVVFEADIGANLSRFAERWGDDYNRNHLTGIRSMVVCNGWYANQVSNLDPDMLALCPLRLTLIEQAGKTRVLFARPSVIAAGSPALAILKEVESLVIRAIDEGLKAK